ncbi:MAG: hypothetical protein FWD16_07595, partial [Clostridia bacterium]|nr:hypothetical protein [Clostridia bacterium]
PDDLIPVENTTNGISITGFLAKPELARGNRTRQFTIIGGRCVNSRTLSLAVERAYAGLLPHGRFPMFCVSLTLPPGDVDCNVHPAKAEVRLHYEREVASFAGAAAKAAAAGFLSGGQWAVSSRHKEADNGQKPVVGGQLEANYDPGVVPIGRQSVDEYLSADSRQHSGSVLPESRPGPHLYSVPRSSQTGFQKEAKVSMPSPLQLSLGIAPNAKPPREENEPYPLSPSQTNADVFETQTHIQPAAQTPSPDNLQTTPNNALPQPIPTYHSPLPVLIFIGQLWQTYLLWQAGEKLYIMDQHAAHERFLFDRYSEQFLQGNVATQTLLEPVPLELSGEEAACLEENLDDLKALGFLIQTADGRGGLSLLSGVPAWLVPCDLPALGRAITESLHDSTEPLKERVMRMACRRAVKAGQTMRREDAEMLLKLALEKGGLTCPHGRPVFTTLTRAELETRFKRF